MQLCFDATRFGLGLLEALELAVAKQIPAIEYAFEPFTTGAKKLTLSAEEKSYLAKVEKLAQVHGIEIACIRLNLVLDCTDRKAVRSFQQMMEKLSMVAKAVGCRRLAFWLQAGLAENWIAAAAEAITPSLELLERDGIKLLLSLSTPVINRTRTLKHWRPLEPQEWRDLIANCPGLSLSFSAADCAWQNIDYLQILAGIVAAVEHVEANDVEVNRALLADSGLFGPLWWRYQRPGKGQIDWRQLIEALKLYDYRGSLSIHLDDEFFDSNDGNLFDGNLEDSLDESIKLLSPLMKY